MKLTDRQRIMLMFEQIEQQFTLDSGALCVNFYGHGQVVFHFNDEYEYKENPALPDYKPARFMGLSWEKERK